MTTEYTRLYISPFSPELAPAILGTQSHSYARKLSYHQLRTFPENNYGYVELPCFEAEKLKKKLNGSILKGRKLRVDEARPMKRKRLDDDAMPHVDRGRQRDLEEHHNEKRSREKEDAKSLRGRQLSPERKVQRGWTDPAAQKKGKRKSEQKLRPSSKYTEKEELLFRTKVPPNKASERPGHNSKETKRKRNQVVHEFEKSSTQPSFLKTDPNTEVRKGLQYADGKGWVDELGTVMEEETSGIAGRRKAFAKQSARSSRSSKEKETLLLLEEQESTPRGDTIKHLNDTLPAEEDTESDEVSSATSSAETSSTPNVPAPPTRSKGQDESSPPSEMHPLEAQFKKPQNLRWKSKQLSHSSKIMTTMNRDRNRNRRRTLVFLELHSAHKTFVLVAYVALLLPRIRPTPVVSISMAVPDYQVMNLWTRKSWSWSRTRAAVS